MYGWSSLHMRLTQPFYYYLERTGFINSYITHILGWLLNDEEMYECFAIGPLKK